MLKEGAEAALARAGRCDPLAAEDWTDLSAAGVEEPGGEESGFGVGSWTGIEALEVVLEEPVGGLLR